MFVSDYERYSLQQKLVYYHRLLFIEYSSSLVEGNIYFISDFHSKSYTELELYFEYLRLHDIVSKTPYLKIFKAYYHLDLDVFNKSIYLLEPSEIQHMFTILDKITRENRIRTESELKELVNSELKEILTETKFSVFDLLLKGS